MQKRCGTYFTTPSINWQPHTTRQSSSRLGHPTTQDGLPAGYADLQNNGYIDHFFIAADHANQGAGRQLMEYLQQQAKQRGLQELSADVSLNAQPFFLHLGFVLLRQQLPVIRGTALVNARMCKSLTTSTQATPP